MNCLVYLGANEVVQNPVLALSFQLGLGKDPRPPSFKCVNNLVSSVHEEPMSPVEKCPCLWLVVAM